MNGPPIAGPICPSLHESPAWPIETPLSHRVCSSLDGKKKKKKTVQRLIDWPARATAAPVFAPASSKTPPLGVSTCCLFAPGLFNEN